MKRIPMVGLVLGALALPALANEEGNWFLLSYSDTHTASLHVPPDADPGAVKLREHVELDLLESAGVMVQSMQDIVANCPAGTLQRGEHEWAYGHAMREVERLPIPDPVAVVVDATARVPQKGSHDDLVLQVACAEPGEGARAGRPRFLGPYLNTQLIWHLQKADPKARLPTAQGIAIGGEFIATASGETHPNRADRALRDKCAAGGVQCAQIFLTRRCLALAGASEGVIPGYGATAKAASDDAMAACKAAGGSDCSLRSEAVCP